MDSKKSVTSFNNQWRANNNMSVVLHRRHPKVVIIRGGHKKPKPNTETELTGTETEFIETELTDANFGA